MTRAVDITWRTQDGVFKYRVAALVSNGDRLLVCEMDSLDYVFLPGGKVRLGEDTRSALARELTEELGRDLTIGSLKLIVENLYQTDQLEHEVCLYYHVHWPVDVSAESVNETVEPGHRFRWIPVTELSGSTLQPAELLPALQSASDRQRHVILDRRSASDRHVRQLTS